MRFAAALACAVLASCAAKPPSPPAPAPTPAPSSRPAASASGHVVLDRVVVVVMENKEYGAVIGSREAPYLNALASTSALATSFHATTHPSLPNYLALTGGDTFGIDSNCTDCHVGSRSLVDQLEDANISWKAYMESAPRPCFTGPSHGRYAKKHNPFVYYDSVVTDPSRCRKVVPLTDLSGDLRSSLPRFVWITPDLCHDTHDCSVRTGDDFLSSLLPPVIAALGPRGALFLTYDEGSSSRGCCRYARGGRIVTVVAGPSARAGRYTQPLDHYSLLRAIEDGFGLPRLGLAASSSTPSMDAMFR